MVSALTRHAAADHEGAAQAIEGFLEAAWLGREWDDPRATKLVSDLANGAAGVLLGAATLLPHAAGAGQRARLLVLGRELRDLLAREVRHDRVTTASPYLGFAHGMAGAMFALLRWADAAKEDSSPGLEQTLGWLAGRANIVDGAAAWPVFAAGPNATAWSGWCHGSAGYAILWARAAQHFGNRDYEYLAVCAAEDAWRARDRMTASLCCGVGGAALAVSEVGRLVGEARWRKRAQFGAALAVRSVGVIPNSESLFKGDVGLGLVAVEALDPSGAFPFGAT
jgi:serine/threonine-protein kinase